MLVLATATIAASSQACPGTLEKLHKIVYCESFTCDECCDPWCTSVCDSLKAKMEQDGCACPTAPRAHTSASFCKDKAAQKTSAGQNQGNTIAAVYPKSAVDSAMNALAPNHAIIDDIEKEDIAFQKKQAAACTEGCKPCCSSGAGSSLLQSARAFRECKACIQELGL